MATRTQSRSTNRSSNRSSESSENRSAFSFGGGSAPIIAAALGGVAIAFAANYGRKALMQGMEAAVGDWDEILATGMNHGVAAGYDRLDTLLAAVR